MIRKTDIAEQFGGKCAETSPLGASGAGALYPEAIAHPGRYPEIRTIEDILPHIRPGTGIHCFEHDDLIVVRYTSSLPETFQTAHDLECRCMIFCRHTGEILSRTFHKFFNLGERQGLADLDFSGPAHLSLKLDGSMMGAFVRRNEVLFHTRGGLSPHSLAARNAAHDGHMALVREAFDSGLTPIFEFTSPANRIIIPYARESLTLLALRGRQSGTYDRAEAARMARKHGVAFAEVLEEGLSGLGEVTSALAEIGQRTDIEGVILGFDDGHRLKSKTADYLRRHKVLANIHQEKYVYLCYLGNVLDDTAAALGGMRGRALTEFIARIENRIEMICREVTDAASDLRDLPPKDRARKIKAAYQGATQAAAFAAVAGHDPRLRIHEIMFRRVHVPEKREALKDELGLPSWDIDIQALR